MISTALTTPTTTTMDITLDNCNSNYLQLQDNDQKHEQEESLLQFPQKALQLYFNVDDSTHSSASTTSLSSMESMNNMSLINVNTATSSLSANTINICTDTTTTMKSRNNKKHKRRVRFGSLEIHEHAVELGGSGVPGCGPSTTLEWNEQSSYMIQSVELYEDLRPSLRRKRSELLQPESLRISVLLSQDGRYTLREINECIKENTTIRKQRAQTIQRQQRTDLFFKLFKFGLLRRKRI